MTTLRRFNPLQEALSLQEAMSQLLAQSFVQPGWTSGRPSSLAFPVDVLESEQAYHLYALLPGTKPEDIDLTVQGSSLTIKAQLHPLAKEGKQAHWLVQEIGTGSFERSLTFPKPIDSEHVETSYEQGVLSVTLPIHESNRPKRIQISNQPQQKMVEAGAS